MASPNFDDDQGAFTPDVDDFTPESAEFTPEFDEIDIEPGFIDRALEDEPGFIFIYNIGSIKHYYLWNLGEKI